MLLPTLLTETDSCSYMTESAELKVSHGNLAVSPATQPEHPLWDSSHDPSLESEGSWWDT